MTMQKFEANCSLDETWESVTSIQLLRSRVGQVVLVSKLRELGESRYHYTFSASLSCGVKRLSCPREKIAGLDTSSTGIQKELGLLFMILGERTGLFKAIRSTSSWFTSSITFTSSLISILLCD
nr:uncharacterized protein LOC113803326 [Penaeus vannamei]